MLQLPAQGLLPRVCPGMCWGGLLNLPKAPKKQTPQAPRSLPHSTPSCLHSGRVYSCSNIQVPAQLLQVLFQTLSPPPHTSRKHFHLPIQPSPAAGLRAFTNPPLPIRPTVLSYPDGSCLLPRASRTENRTCFQLATGRMNSGLASSQLCSMKSGVQALNQCF